MVGDYIIKNDVIFNQSLRQLDFSDDPFYYSQTIKKKREKHELLKERFTLA